MFFEAARRGLLENDSAVQKSRNFPGGDRPAEEKALHLVTSVISQKIELMPGFHSLRHHFKIETVGHRNDGLGNRGVGRILADIINKRSVYFEAVQRKTPEPAERRIR